MYGSLFLLVASLEGLFVDEWEGGVDEFQREHPDFACVASEIFLGLLVGFLRELYSALVRVFPLLIDFE